MPLVRVSGSDAESFDTFDVAEMTDHRDKHGQRNSWSSRQSGGGGQAAANARHLHAKNVLSSTLETDDLTSIDSSSGRRSDEASDRVGSIPPRGSISGQRSFNQSSTNSLGSANSYYTPPVSHPGSSDNVHSTQSPYNNVPLYETVDNLDEMQHDPRNPFNKSHSTLRTSWGDNIPEEDETSLSTMDESSTAPSTAQNQSNHYHNQHSLPSAHQMHQPQLRSHRHRQKLQPSSVPEWDDSSIASHQSSRQDFNRKNTNKNNDNSAHIISQLESQVAKINFELATTKSSLDELQLENRRLNDDKDKLNTDITLLKEENHQLHLKIERLEKEKILRNMEGTKGKGVARPSIDQDSCVVWGGGTVSGNTWAKDGESVVSSNRAYVPVTKQRLGKVGGDALEVPFRTSDSDYHLRPKRLSVSMASTGSFNELSDGDAASREEVDCNSVTLNDSGHKLPSSDDEPEMTAQRGRTNLMAMIGGGKIPSVREITKQTEEAFISFPPRRNREGDEKTGIQAQSDQEHDHFETGDADDNDIGSNPQGEGEDFNDDDPFATWSAPGDPKRKESEQNWLQKGLGGRRGRNNNQNSQQIPQSNELIEDPFDSCRDGQRDYDDDTEKYTSFADNSSLGSGSNGNEGNASAAAQDRKRFGLFNGLMRGGRRGT